MKTPLILLIACFTLTLTSCKKEGCTDLDATNYSSSAKTNDGSCSFEGNIVLWFGESTSNFLTSDGAQSLTYYVDGQVVGSEAANIFWTAEPDCGQNSSITVTKNLGNAKNMSYTYSVVDQTGHEYYSGVLNFTANTCTALELN